MRACACVRARASLSCLTSPPLLHRSMDRVETWWLYSGCTQEDFRWSENIASPMSFGLSGDTNSPCKYVLCIAIPGGSGNYKLYGNKMSVLLNSPLPSTDLLMSLFLIVLSFPLPHRLSPAPLVVRSVC